MTTQSSGNRSRTDARRNRDQILATATRLFASGNVDMSMQSIAEEAGVGMATLYRCFPGREALILAVAQESYNAIVGEIETAQGEEPTAWATLERIIRFAFKMRLNFRLMSKQKSSEPAKTSGFSGYQHEIFTPTEEIIAKAQAEGSLRTDIGLGDVLTLYHGIAGNKDTASDDLDLAAERALTIMFDGLRTATPSPLRGKPATPQPSAMSRGAQRSGRH